MLSQSSDSNFRSWHSHYDANTKPHLDDSKFKNIPDMLHKNSEQWDNKIAFSISLPNGAHASLTYKELEIYSDSFAVYLRENLLIKKGDRIAVQMPNCLVYPVAIFGILKAGGVIVNTNPLYTASETTHQYIDSEPKILIIMDMFADNLKEVIPNTKIKKVILASVVDFFPPIKKQFFHCVLKYAKKVIPKCEVQYTEFEQALKIGAQIKKTQKIKVEDYWKSIEANDLCALQYTGGTTGISKGAMLTHGNILANMVQVFEMLQSKIEYGKEVLLMPLPMYHVFAFITSICFCKCGGAIVLIPNPRPLKNLKKAFETYPVTWIAGVNTLFNGLLNESWFNKNIPKYLRASIAGGTALFTSVAERWQEVTKTIIYEGYGLTETSPVITLKLGDSALKSGSVGIPVPSTDVTLLNDDGEPVTLGSPGEIAVKGPQVMLGYWKRPDETQKVFKNGWLLTGDIGTMDEDGFLKIVDRKKDMILVSGFNVYPNEIEDCISKLDGVQEVAVIGLPSESSGEFVKAFIVKKDSELTQEQVQSHCKQFLTHYKLPKQIEFRSELPKTPVGKILRKDLRMSAN